MKHNYKVATFPLSYVVQQKTCFLLLRQVSVGVLRERCWKGKPLEHVCEGFPDFAEELWIRNSRKTRSTLDERRDAVRPLVMPATSRPGEPFPTYEHIM